MCYEVRKGSSLEIHTSYSQIRVSRNKEPYASAFEDTSLWIQTMAQNVSHLSVSFYKAKNLEFFRKKTSGMSRKHRMIDETRMLTSNLRA